MLHQLNLLENIGMIVRPLELLFCRQQVSQRSHILTVAVNRPANEATQTDETAEFLARFRHRQALDGLHFLRISTDTISREDEAQILYLVGNELALLQIDVKMVQAQAGKHDFKVAQVSTEEGAGGGNKCNDN